MAVLLVSIRSPSCLFICLLSLLTSYLVSTEGVTGRYVAPLNRSAFPAGFVFGAGSAAYQYEGAAFVDGKGPSIWDTFTHQHPEKISDHSTGDVTDDMYHLYKEDIILMKETGLDAFRFSISWPRVLPKGRVSGGVNPLGVQYYNNFIDDLLAKGIVPYVTLFHWDFPQALEDEYGGFLSNKVVDDFRDYGDFLFKTFGDRVKNWFTINEPYTYAYFGYTLGLNAPGRCSSYLGNCSAGDSATESYIVAHQMILAHGATVKLYNEKYKSFQNGQIGITLATNWFIPATVTVDSEKAAQRGIDFMIGWFLDPVTYGDYPSTMRDLVGKRLPKFTPEESKMLIKSYDILGLNYYTTSFASKSVSSNSATQSPVTDSDAITASTYNGVAIGPATPLFWLYVYPKGIRDLTLYIKDSYGNPPVYITENGIADANNESLPIGQALKDKVRIEYMYQHLRYLSQSIKDGANVLGYFAWSFLDNYEWASGFNYRFGLYYVDYKDKYLKRHPKYSAFWFKKFLQK